MAEYFPLLERAVAGMRNASAEQRRAIYDRARGALLDQLRSMEPAVPEASIEREATALDAAIERVEASLTGGQEQAAAPPPAVPTSPSPEPALDPPTPAPSVDAAAPQDAAPAGAVPAPAVVPRRPARAPRTPAVPPPAEAVLPAEPPAPEPPPTPVAQAIAAPEPVPAPPLAVPPSAAPAPRSPAVPPPTVPPPVVPPPTVPQVAMPLRAVPARPAAEALSRIVAERGPVAPVIRASRQPDLPAGSAMLPLPSAPRLEMPSFADAMTAAGERSPGDGLTAGGADDGEADSIDGARGEPLRPLAPRPSTGERFNGRALILAAVGLAVIAGIAYAAWRLRDRPEALARSQAAMLAEQQADLQSAAKVSTRAGVNATTSAPAAPVAATTPPKAPLPEPAVQTPVAPAAPTPAISPPASQPPAAPAGDQTTQNAVPAATPDATTPAPVLTPSPPAIPVAQRAAFLVDAPDDPAKVKTYVGTVVWTTDNASPVQNQPISRAVHAEIDVPDAGIKLSMTFQKNFEAQFPASHTLELRFTLLPTNTLGPVKQINMPQMRKDDAPAGDGLIGLPVTITDNYFLVGLSRGDATAANLDLIKSRNWFDIPLLLTSGKVAKITFEKGTTGQRAIDDVLQSWQ